MFLFKNLDVLETKLLGQIIRTFIIIFFSSAPEIFITETFN